MQIQKLRLKRGWSQQQLAELSGLSVRTIQRIENSKPASAESLKSLASVFEIDFSNLTSEPEMHAAHSTSLDEQLALSHVRKVRGLYIHAAQYAVVIPLLCIINLIANPARLWFYWPALGWGIGLLMHAVSVFKPIPFLGAEWEKRQIEKRLGRSL